MESATAEVGTSPAVTGSRQRFGQSLRPTSNNGSRMHTESATAEVGTAPAVTGSRQRFGQSLRPTSNNGSRMHTESAMAEVGTAGKSRVGGVGRRRSRDGGCSQGPPTARARINSLNAFKRWVASENVPFEYLLTRIAQDATASVFEAAMDKYGIHLAFNEGSRGRKLTKSTVIQYYRQDKNWLQEKNPSLRVSLEERLQKMARTLERNCLKREHGGVVKKAEACTKQALCVLVQWL
ncbi:hypothetical protein H257_10314 [Aphanomyces astaci]|uniref:Uncharacterized protein n=1 Tax=Aphanomyces astaci TaxID=112090 RepID=W4G6Z1_APHAT|nr:hypothetical protein H257_10314 [Aphanomyces astaci]ETV75477.1 hypothetical protein H257_10314 [Aphanomyces astaci]|eukprot:XP_009835111.1 hypothetical protein H257_10314 [Aphanomyces astaci]